VKQETIETAIDRLLEAITKTQAPEQQPAEPSAGAKQAADRGDHVAHGGPVRVLAGVFGVEVENLKEGNGKSSQNHLLLGRRIDQEKTPDSLNR